MEHGKHKMPGGMVMEDKDMMPKPKGKKKGKVKGKGKGSKK